MSHLSSEAPHRRYPLRSARWRKRKRSAILPQAPCFGRPIRRQNPMENFADTTARDPIPCRKSTDASSDREIQPCPALPDRKSTRLNSSHVEISYAVFCLKKKNKTRK